MTLVTGGGAGSGDTPGPGWTPERARARVVHRLRARRSEIDEAIFARISDHWFDRTGSEDPKYVAGLHAAGVAALDYVLVGIERPVESLAPVPAAALAQARRAARTGVGFETVLRRYVAGYAVLEGFVTWEAEHDQLLGHPSTLRDVLQTMSLLVDRLITAVSSAYGKELERAPHAPAPRASPGRVVGPRSDRTSRRDRILQAMVEVAGERGFASTSVKLLASRAGVSTSTFYEEFKSLRDCFEAVLDLALQRAGGLIAQAFVREERWQDGVLGALASLLLFFDSEPLLTRVWFVETMAAGSWALRRREHIVAELRSMIVEYGAAQGEEPPDPVAAAGVMAAVLGLIQTHLVTEQPEPLIELLGPSMGLVTTFYFDREDVKREIERGARLARDIRAGHTRWTPLAPQTQPGPAPVVPLPAKLADPSARRARECLLYLAEQGRRGLSPSNSEIATAIGVAHKSQISRLLSYLLEEGLAVKRSDGGPGAPNAWRLTPRGHEIARALAKRKD